MGVDGPRSTSKVPEVALIFWIVKIFATTLGETAGDAVSMSLNFGYFAGTLIFAACFILAVTAQVVVQKFHPILYWTTIVATTTVGTPLRVSSRAGKMNLALGNAARIAAR